MKMYHSLQFRLCRCFRMLNSKGLCKTLIYLCILVSCLPSSQPVLSVLWSYCPTLVTSGTSTYLSKESNYQAFTSINKGRWLFFRGRLLPPLTKITLWSTYFPLTIKGAVPYWVLGMWNSRRSDLRMWDSEWQIQAYLFRKKPTYPRASSHTASVSQGSQCIQTI